MNLICLRKFSYVAFAVVGAFYAFAGCMLTNLQPTPVKTHQNNTPVSTDISPPAKVYLSLVKTWKTDSITGIAWSPSSEKIVVSSAGENHVYKLSLYDIEMYQEQWLQEKVGATVGTIFTEDGNLLIEIHRFYGLLQLRRSVDGIVVREMEANNCSGGEILLLRQNENKLVVGNPALPRTESSNINLWDIQTGECKELLSFNGYLVSLNIDPEENLLLISSFYDDNQVFVWDIEKQAEICRVPGKYGIFAPNGLMAVSEDQKLSLWVPDTCKIVQEFTIPSTYLGYIAFSPNGQIFATVGESLQIWEISTGKLLFQNQFSKNLTPSSNQKRLIFSPDGRFLIAIFSLTGENTPNNVVQLWEIEY